MNNDLRREIIDRLREIIGWSSPSADEIYVAAYNDFFMDDLPSETDPQSLTGFVLVGDELPLFLKFIEEWMEVRRQLGRHDIFRAQRLPAGLDFTDLQKAASTLLRKMEVRIG